MSRHRIPHPTHEIIVGWDNPLESFFAQVIAPKVDPNDDLEDDVFVVDIGWRPREIQDVHRFKQMLEGQAHEAGVEVELSLELQAKLMLEQAEATGPTELQREMLALVAGIEKSMKEGKS